MPGVPEVNMPDARTTRHSALTPMGAPEHPEAILEPGESPRENERQQNLKTRLQNTLNTLEALQSRDVQQSGSDTRTLLESLQQQCQRHLGQTPEATIHPQTAALLQPPSSQTPAPSPSSGGNTPPLGGPAPAPSAPAPSPTPSGSGASTVSLAQIAHDHDAHGRYRQADVVDAMITRLAQTQLQSLAEQGLQGVGNVGTGLADVAQGAWGIGQTLNPVNWAAAAGADTVSGVHDWFNGQVNDAVAQRLRAMGLDPSKSTSGAQLAPANAQSAATPGTPTGAAPTPTAPPTASSPATANGQPGAEDPGLVERYLGWAFWGISQKRLPSATVRADLAAHLAQSRQSPAFTQMVLQQFDSRIGNQQAVKRQDAALAAGR